MNQSHETKKGFGLLHYIYSLVFMAVLLCIDQYTKFLAQMHLKGQESFVLIDKALEFSYLENTGAAFSSFLGRQTFLITLTVLMVAVMVWKYCVLPPDKHYHGMRICLLFVISGALGNLIDRVSHRYVIDFIYFVPINFPKFNVADIYITVGVAVLALLLFTRYSDEDLEVFLKIH